MRAARSRWCIWATRAAGLALALVGLVPSPGRGQPAARAPVVLELYSSEGCSSCPSAEQVLAELDAAGQVAGVAVLALELHVDYWDYLGWRDPFSAAAFTARQERYRSWLGVRSYTPQLVIDGHADVLGSSRQRAGAAIAAAAQRASSAAVQLARRGEALTVQVTARPGELDPVVDNAVMLAITERGLQTRVLRGENAGQTLRHGPVVRALRQLGVMRGAGYAATVPLQLDRAFRPEALRAVVFVQSAADGQILGAAALPLGPGRAAATSP
jgi:hypothetical protein